MPIFNANIEVESLKSHDLHFLDHGCVSMLCLPDQWKHTRNPAHLFFFFFFISKTCTFSPHFTFGLRIPEEGWMGGGGAVVVLPVPFLPCCHF